MEVDSPAMKISEITSGSSKAGSGVIINDDIMQVFISIPFLTIIIPTICCIYVGTIRCHTVESKSSPICTIGYTQHVIGAVSLAISDQYNVHDLFVYVVTSRCHTVETKSSPICIIGYTWHVIWAVFLAIFLRVCTYLLCLKNN